MSIVQRAAGEGQEESKEGMPGRATDGLLAAGLLMLTLSSESNKNVRDKTWSR